MPLGMQAGVPESRIAEEIPDQVWKVDFEGNETFADVILEEQIATTSPTFLEKLRFWKRTGHKFNEMEVRKDVIRIRNYYLRRGFINVSVSYRVEEGNKSWKKEVVFVIDENAPVRIRNLEFDITTSPQNLDYIRTSPEFSRARRRQPFREGRRYEQIREPEVIGQLEDALKNLGFAYAEVSIDVEIDTARLAADLVIRCDTGPMTYIDKIEVEGLESISERYVLRETGLKQGERYSLDGLQNAQKEVFNHHLFRFAIISIPEQERDTTLNLQLRVRENSLRSVQAAIGFGTEDYLRGQLSWTHRNAFDRGHKFTATARASFIEQTLGVDYLLPYIYNTKSSLVISPFAQHLLERNFELLSGGITNSFIYRYSERVTGSASYRFTKNKELSKQLDASLPDTAFQYDLSSLQFTGYYNQGFGLQQRGWVIQPYLEFSGFFGFATFQFQKASIDIRKYTQLTQSTTLATRVQAGGLFNVASDSLPGEIRFYLGGTSSVRGWYRHNLGPKQARTKQDSVRQIGGTYTDTTRFVDYIPEGGQAMLGFSLEIRQSLNQLINGFGIALFLDGGQVWHNFDTLGNRPIQFGVGGGFRYQSPIGPLRIDIAYKLNPTDEDLNIYQGVRYGSAWDRIGIHFSIGQAF